MLGNARTDGQEGLLTPRTTLFPKGLQKHQVLREQPGGSKGKESQKEAEDPGKRVNYGVEELHGQDWEKGRVRK